MWESDHKAEYWRIDAFELWCWRRLLSVPWTARRSKLSILKEINPEYSLEGLMLKLKLQYFHHLTLKLGNVESGRRGWQRVKWLDGITELMDLSLSKLQELVMDQETRHAAVHEVAKNWTPLRDWSELQLLTCMKYYTAAGLVIWLFALLVKGAEWFIL